MFTGRCAASRSLPPPIHPWRRLMGCLKYTLVSLNSCPVQEWRHGFKSVACISLSAPLYRVCSSCYFLHLGSFRFLTTWNKHRHIFTGKLFECSTTQNYWALNCSKIFGHHLKCCLTHRHFLWTVVDVRIPCALSVKVHPRTDHEGPKGVGGQRHAPAALPPGEHCLYSLLIVYNSAA
jgi:hypothetical protein